MTVKTLEDILAYMRTYSVREKKKEEVNWPELRQTMCFPPNNKDEEFNTVKEIVQGRER